MPRKIGFTVVSWSGHEENYSAKELMVHAPTVSGWRSARYVSLSNNEKTGFRARELKSVHVDAVGTYLKLTFHRNHVNQYNIYNQVALVAINILGDSVDCSDISPAPSRDRLIEQYLSSTQHSSALDGSYTGSKYESISPLDDLAFDMYQDPEVAHIIRLLDDKKQDMVRLERYDLAKKLKQAIADLQKVGERLGRYDVEKHSAIEREDYDTAKQKKEQMESYRLKVYQQLELHDLLDIGQVRLLSTVQSQILFIHLNHAFIQLISLFMYSCIHSSTTLLPFMYLYIFPQVLSMPYDERPLPALRKRSGEQPQHEHLAALLDSSDPRSPRATGEPEPLTEKAQREASLPIEVYGDSLVAGVYSKTWSYREDALLAVCKKLTEVPPGTPKAELKNMMRAAVFLCKKALSDKVSSVFQASLKLLRMVLSEFVSSHQLGRSEVSYCGEQIWPALLSRTGESTPRLRALAITFIQEMAVYKEVRALQLVPTELVKPMKSSLPARLALSRLELLEKLLEQLGTKDSGFTLENVMRFLTGVLEHSAASVRELAVRVVQTMYRQHGPVVLHYLPSEDANERKNVLYKNLFDSFSKIDGRLPDTQMLKGRSMQKEGEREKEEIRSLQEQLAVLKEIMIGANVLCSSVCSNCILYCSLCIFCGEKDKSFTEEGLDLHYWKHCPMLCRCLQCRQVVEISSLTEHLLTECEHRADFVQCPCCSEAIIRDQLTEHAQSTTCNCEYFLCCHALVFTPSADTAVVS
uniref:Centrosomal protein of 104 kDa n=1 Tax=Pygocentrus nattereri TaxID=42514 RepID=A0AAR2KEX6_PYGNA